MKKILLIFVLILGFIFIGTAKIGAKMTNEVNEVRAEHILVETESEAANLKSQIENGEITFEDALLKVRELAKGGKRGADACREVAKETGYAKSELYAALVERSDGGSPDKNS